MRATLVVLAAGAGRRYGGLKQLEEIGPSGELLLEYSVYDALQFGFSRLVLVVRPEAEDEFRGRLERMSRRLPVTYAHQRLESESAGITPKIPREKPWGTAHAVLAAQDSVDGVFGVVNADDFYGRASFEALGAALAGSASGPRAVVVGFNVRDTLSDSGPVSRAVCEVDGAARLLRIVELLEVWSDQGRVLYRSASGEVRRLEGDERVSMNMWGFSPEIFDCLGARFRTFVSGPAASTAEFLLPEVVQALIDEVEFNVSVVPGSDLWCGVTFREDRARAAATIAELVERGYYPKELWA